MKVKLLIPRSSNTGAQNIGDEVDVSMAEYEAMLAAGHCGEHAEAAAEQAEIDAAAQADAKRLEAEQVAAEEAAKAEAERQAATDAEVAVAIVDAETTAVAVDAETATPKRKPKRA
jgi:hypothetical protein